MFLHIEDSDDWIDGVDTTLKVRPFNCAFVSCFTHDFQIFDICMDEMMTGVSDLQRLLSAPKMDSYHKRYIAPADIPEYLEIGQNLEEVEKIMSIVGLTSEEKVTSEMEEIFGYDIAIATMVAWPGMKKERRSKIQQFAAWVHQESVKVRDFREDLVLRNPLVRSLRWRLDTELDAHLRDAGVCAWGDGFEMDDESRSEESSDEGEGTELVTRSWKKSVEEARRGITSFVKVVEKHPAYRMERNKEEGPSQRVLDAFRNLVDVRSFLNIISILILSYSSRFWTMSGSSMNGKRHKKHTPMRPCPFPRDSFPASNISI